MNKKSYTPLGLFLLFGLLRIDLCAMQDNDSAPTSSITTNSIEAPGTSSSTAVVVVEPITDVPSSSTTDAFDINDNDISIPEATPKSVEELCNQIDVLFVSKENVQSKPELKSALYDLMRAIFLRMHFFEAYVAEKFHQKKDKTYNLWFFFDGIEYALLDAESQACTNLPDKFAKILGKAEALLSLKKSQVNFESLRVFFDCRETLCEKFKNFEKANLQNLSLIRPWSEEIKKQLSLKKANEFYDFIMKILPNPKFDDLLNKKRFMNRLETGGLDEIHYLDTTYISKFKPSIKRLKYIHEGRDELKKILDENLWITTRWPEEVKILQNIIQKSCDFYVIYEAMDKAEIQLQDEILPIYKNKSALFFYTYGALYKKLQLFLQPQEEVLIGYGQRMYYPLPYYPLLFHPSDNIAKNEEVMNFLDKLRDEIKTEIETKNKTDSIDVSAEWIENCIALTMKHENSQFARDLYLLQAGPFFSGTSSHAEICLVIANLIKNIKSLTQQDVELIIKIPGHEERLKKIIQNIPKQALTKAFLQVINVLVDLKTVPICHTVMLPFMEYLIKELACSNANLKSEQEVALRRLEAKEKKAEQQKLREKKCEETKHRELKKAEKKAARDKRRQQKKSQNVDVKQEQSAHQQEIVSIVEQRPSEAYGPSEVLITTTSSDKCTSVLEPISTEIIPVTSIPSSPKLHASPKLFIEKIAEPMVLESVGQTLSAVLFNLPEIVVRESDKFAIIEKYWNNPARNYPEKFSVIIYRAKIPCEKKIENIRYDYKSDKFHQIPEWAINHLADGEFIESEFENKIITLPYENRTGGPVEILPEQYAIILPAVLVLGSHASFILNQQDDSYAQGLINKTCLDGKIPGFYRGAYLFIGNRINGKCFHSQFHRSLF